MKATLEALGAEIQAALDTCRTDDDLERIRVGYLGRKGRLTELMRGVGALPADDRPVIGDLANQLKRRVDERIESLRRGWEAERRAQALANERIDVTLPGRVGVHGHVHPLTVVLDEAIGILVGLGFSVYEGPHIEDDHHNFTALNIPADHPARDMHDTFFVDESHVLRTHTSPVQIRVMENQEPPIAALVPGPVYRHEVETVKNSAMFHQIEGFLVDRRVTFGDLKGVLALFVQRMFGDDTRVRFRPSFFPFTEPSAEVDISCVICRGARRLPTGDPCRVCKASGWLEILGSGLIHPEVFLSVGYDPEVVSGFAFGMGVERMAMLKYGITDIRLFYQNDLRFLRQF
ncbi:MAG: phenylalanine--tRNA ligase subunit alpha [Deltaproteobacteria bacterium]|nr:phenylalanine--tRNA ligase subunit alpha [Deltaproteobacteria bacterium]